MPWIEYECRSTHVFTSPDVIKIKYDVPGTSLGRLLGVARLSFWEFQNNALWDTHQHALLTHVLTRPQERDRRMGAYFEQELGSCSTC